MTDRHPKPNIAEPFETDPALTALLDDALAPDAWPGEAKQRTLDAVLQAQQSPSDAATEAPVPTYIPNPVLARIGPVLAWGIAAVLALGTVALVLPFGKVSPNPGDRPDPGPSQIAVADDLEAELQPTLDAWSQTTQRVLEPAAATGWNTDADSAFDAELADLETQLALTADDAFWSSGAADLQRELDTISSPADATF